MILLIVKLELIDKSYEMIRKLNVSLFPILLFLFQFNVGKSQDLLKFSGPFLLDEEEGNAEFSFFMEDSVRKISGPFNYNSEYFNDEGIFVQRTISGEYSEGRKAGAWTYLNNYFDIKVKSVGKNFQVQSDVSGRTSALKANYQAGLASNKWIYEEQVIENGSLSHRDKLVEVIFNRGKMAGPFSYQSDDPNFPMKITGAFSDDGYFDGEWNLDYFVDSVRYLEKRIYKGGFLTNLQVENINEGILIHEVSYETVVNKLEMLTQEDADLDFAVGDKPFGLLFDDGFRSFSEEEVSQYLGNEVLGTVLNTFQSDVITGLDLEGAGRIEIGSTRRFEYTFTRREQTALQELSELIDQRTSDIQKFISNTSLYLNRQKSDSLAFSYKFHENSLNKYEILRKEIDRLKGDEFKYQSREFYYKDGIVGIDRIDTISYTFDGESRFRIFDNGVSLQNGDGIIFNILAYAKQKAENLDQFDPFMRASLIDIERDIESQQLEESILVYLDSLEQIFDVKRGFDVVDSDSIPLTYFLLDMYSNYHKKLDIKMQAYSNADGFAELQESGLEIIGLVQAYIEAYEPIGLVRSRMKVIDEAYTRYDYNPYMDRHDIKTRTKRNIFMAAMEYLLPDYRNRIIALDDYEELLPLIEEMEEAFERLLEISTLPDSETRSMERRLRRESNPERIKRVLGI